MTLRVEFTIEPFVAGEPGDHVLAGNEAAVLHGLAVEFGPFGSSGEGPDDIVLGAVDAAVRAAMAAGATQVTVQVSRV